jgi:hypothetical protein
MLGSAALAAAVWLGVQAPTMAATFGDGFAPFWQAFSAALVKDDQASLAKMVALSDRLDQAKPLTFARFHRDHLGPAARKCVAKARPVRDVDGEGQVNYTAFCGELTYTFTRAGGAWKLTDIGPND